MYLGQMYANKTQLVYIKLPWQPAVLVSGLVVKSGYLQLLCRGRVILRETSGTTVSLGVPQGSALGAFTFR